ncbi:MULTISPECIES: pyridoxal phosphate-dependent aminotransferase [Gordonia]|uniref:pyridoxal phosphate-dependent aminotransferase n=1 Tax=Gordonia TaxID=2053 RepID=UPI001FE39E5F|nr:MULTISPECIES: aminotransferase class I/II-fold pyridoxal phosphate-dependent enzyme [Gordonia]
MTAVVLRPAAAPVVARCDLNESAYPPLPEVAAALAEHASNAHRYPEFLPDGLRATIATHLGLDRAAVTVGAGGTAVAFAILQDCVTRAETAAPRIATPMPTFDGFAILARMLGATLDPSPLTPSGVPDLDALRSRIGPDTVAVILCSPHNPTGAIVDDTELRAFLRAVPSGVRVILDQAYVEYQENPPDTTSLFEVNPNVVVLRTFSKAYGLAGLRAGYAFGIPETIAEPRDHEVPFAVNAAAEYAVPVALAAQPQLRQRVEAMRAERDRLTVALTDLGCLVLPSHANFVYLPGADGIAVGRLLRSIGVIGKECGTYGFRLTVTNSRTTDYLIDALRLTAHTA